MIKKQSNIKLASVVVFYNPTKENVDNIKNYYDLVDKVYIIDNSSKDNSNLINDKKIEYIPNLDNLGMAYALNKGANLAINDGFNYLLTMDQDSKLYKDTLNKMIDYINNNNVDKIGIISPWHVIKSGITKPKGDVDYPFEVMTSGNIVNLKIYSKIGGWDNELFIDDVDIDYCMNLNLNGYKVVRLLDAEMVHSLGNIKIKHIWPLKRDFVCSNHNYIRRYYMARNLVYLEKKYKGKFDNYLSFMRSGLYGQIKNILVFENDKYRKIKCIIKGMKDAKKGKMGKYK